jgi:hypothetical protein
MCTVAKSVEASTTCIAAQSLKEDISRQSKLSYSLKLARELEISRTTATEVRHLLQANAEREQANEPLSDLEVETDEMCQNAGEKR